MTITDLVSHIGIIGNSDYPSLVAPANSMAN